MANQLNPLLPKILARGLRALRETAAMPRLVNMDYGMEAAQKGATIEIPLSSAITVQDVVPGALPVQAQDSAPTTVSVKLDKWKSASFGLTDGDLVQIDAGRDFLPGQMNEAVRALANTCNSDIHSKARGLYGFIGAEGTAPFSTLADVVDARRVLNKQTAPLSDRRLVVDPDAEAKAISLKEFNDVSQSSDRAVKIEGDLGRKLGFDFVMDTNVGFHTAGTAGGTDGAGLKAGVAGTAGATTVALTAQTGKGGNLVEGDIITFAGDSQTYVVKEAAAVSDSANVVVKIAPALKHDVALNAAVARKASHVMNLAFHRDCFAFANRPLLAATGEYELGSRLMSMTDPETGISLRLEVSRQHKQVKWDLDILFGSGLIRPELGVRIAG